MIDVFAAAKWKRMRITDQDAASQREHVRRTGTTSRCLHYPQNPRMFKLGISWSFYD